VPLVSVFFLVGVAPASVFFLGGMVMLCWWIVGGCVFVVEFEVMLCGVDVMVSEEV
jgi:hypothetical protein